MMANYDILNNIKDISYLNKEMELSIRQVSDYYEVTKKAIETIISRHKDELKEGIYILKGKKLKDLKASSEIVPNKAQILTVMSKWSVLLIAFYLQGNNIANKVKTDLLKVNPNLYKHYSDITLSTGWNKRYEKGFEEVLYPLLNNYNKIEKQVRCSNYRIDFVINNFIAIEIDENGHRGYDSEDEIKREKHIKNSGYELMRFDPNKQNCLEFIGEIIQLIHTTNGIKAIKSSF